MQQSTSSESALSKHVPAQQLSVQNTIFFLGSVYGCCQVIKEGKEVINGLP